ncbi:MAG: hypothetical protein KBF12_13440 [Sebaldella sp.]|nr:hypothetical protein [Sebaldella sp.]
MKKFIIMSMLGTLSMIGKGEIVVNSSADTVSVVTNGAISTDDLKITGSGPGGTGSITPNWYLHGYNVNSGIQFSNENTIETSGTYNNGVLLNNNSSFENSGNINISGTNSYGVLSSDGTANIINTSTGVITFNNSYIAVGAPNYNGSNFSGDIQNDGSILGTKGGTGISAHGNGGTVTNNGLINIEGGSTSRAIFMSGKSFMENNGEISGSSTSTSPINALISIEDGMELHNSTTGTIIGENNVNGIYSENSNLSTINKVTNDGLINVNKGYGIYSLGSDVINNGTISSNKVSIYISKFEGNTAISTFINNGTVIANTGGTGININRSDAENNGIIEIAGNNSTGITIYSTSATNANFTNNVDINVDSFKTGVTLVKVNQIDSTFINKANLTVLGDDSIAIHSEDDGEISNIGNITVNNGTGIKLEDSSLLNGDNTGKIIVNGSGIGILSEDSVLESDVEIDLQSNGTGIYAYTGGSQSLGTTGENTGLINFNGNGGTGIYVTDHNTIFKNSVDLTANKKNITGIVVTTGGSAENTGNITLTGDDSVGINILNTGVLSSNTGMITVNNGIGINVENAVLSDTQNTGIINVGSENGIGISGVDSEITNNGVIYVNGLGLGLYGNNSNIENFGEVNVSDGTGIVVENNSVLTNKALLSITGEGTGISGNNSSITNESTGNITLKKGTNISAQSSMVKNYGVLSNDDGIGLYGNNSNIENYGDINVIAGTGIKVENNSYLTNSGILNTGDTGINTVNSTINNTGNINSTSGIAANESAVLNNGIINAIETGLYALNNVKTINAGEINGKTGVMIDSGTEEYSGHFLNSGKISGTDYAIKFDNSDSVLELSNGSEITGKIDASGGENILIINGDMKLDEASNFNKLVVTGSSKLEGIVNLNPTSDSSYYTEAFGAKKDLHDLANETLLGDLIVDGTINIGVNYDNIINETDKTGKIVAQSLNLQNGKIVLTNGGTTTDDIITESGLTSYGDQIRIKSIIISNKQQAVNPDFEFQAGNGMAEKAGWSRETYSRLENGVTVLDEVYTNNNAVIPPEPPVPTPPDPVPSKKVNSVPRNRVDLDTVNRLDSITNRFLQMETKDMNAGERRQSIEYVGTKAGSDFNANNNYNYDYGVDTDGIVGTTLHKNIENLYSGFTLGYAKSDVDYSNADTEKVDSLNINVFGRYEKGNWELDGHAGYGYNRHTLEADWLGAGEQESTYNSHVIKTGLSLGYNQELGNSGVKLRPNLGIDYVLVSEGTIETRGMSDIESTRGTGFVGKMGVDIGSVNGKIVWNAGVSYTQNFVDTFHEDRDMSNGYVMEELHYGKENFLANLDIDYRVTDKFTLKTGYEYEKNSNYENHKFNTGISYILGEK